MLYELELRAALEAAGRAGQELLGLYERFVAIPNAPASISTEADRRAQETIVGFLREQFPGDAFCAEEDSPALAGAPQTGPRLWIIDPIDGTRGFARKNGEFSVMVAFVDRGRVAVGVVLEPAHDRLTYAVRGGGCWQRPAWRGDPSACRVSTMDNPARMTLTQSRSRGPDAPTLAVRALKPARVIETYSAGIKLALVARGEADVYVNNYGAFHDWDICAGHILVEEAGGRVTGLGGEELRYGLEGAWQRYGLLASNGRLHDAALKAWRVSGP
ncbi:MAG TPA: 3'(2'),5'-bisphosphate nucleotidase CysQ [Gemmataceae bacterium]|nr:3'(2'),5'-bisphosphate nucleotidase CysQ [Gemmataceae bacterium]